MTIFNWLAQNYPNSRELIYSPAGGRQIWNGQPHYYSEPTRSDHFDHIHWAMRNGGAVVGQGGPRDDMVRILGSNGEHMLTAKDVALMGGQQAVYAFREALDRGAIGARSRDTSVDRMVSTVTGMGGSGPSTSVAGFVNNGTVVVRDEAALMRKSEMSKRAAMAAIGV
jgi:hypothetical protein